MKGLETESNTGGKYIIKDGKLIPEHDLFAWARWLESEEGRSSRRIDLTVVEGYTVSTVFLGMDYSIFTKEEPALFETMVFGSESSKNHDDEIVDLVERYPTIESARYGHQEVVKKVRELLKDKNGKE